MNTELKINYKDIIELKKQISNPFSREVYIGNIKKEYGEGFSVWYNMGNGFAVFARSFTLKQDTILIEESDVAATVFIFNLGEELSFIYKDKKDFTLEEDRFLVSLASGEFYVETYLKKDTRYITFSIGMKEELFLKLSQPNKEMDKHLIKVKNDSYAILDKDDIDTKQYEILEYFKEQTTFENLLENLFLESKVNDLTHYTIQKISKKKEKKATQKNINKNRISSLQRAKEIILSEYDKNLSIKDIAYKSAINECYLKKDFKTYYGMTIHEMLQKKRMDIAKELLKKEFSVKEVSLKVGYKHTGNFSKLFNKYFCVTPSNYKKKYS